MKNASRSTALMRPAPFVRCIIDLFIGDSLRQRVAFLKKKQRGGQHILRELFVVFANSSHEKLQIDVEYGVLLQTSDDA
jgi:hypothetical protein